MLTRTVELDKLNTQIVIYKRGTRIQSAAYELHYDEERGIYYLTNLDLRGENLDLELIAVLKEQKRMPREESYIEFYLIQPEVTDNQTETQTENHNSYSLLELKIIQDNTPQGIILKEIILERAYKI